MKGSLTTDLANELIKPVQEHNIKFHCYTDDPRGLDPRFNIHPLLEEDIKKHIHWNMFKNIDIKLVFIRFFNISMYYFMFFLCFSFN